MPADKIGEEMGNIVDTVEDRIQNSFLTAIDDIIIPRIELAVGSINAFSGQDTASVTAKLERGKYIGITASFENISERNKTFHKINSDEETGGNIPDEADEFPVPRTHLTGSHTLITRTPMNAS